jgi:hypothetical protein
LTVPSSQLRVDPELVQATTDTFDFGQIQANVVGGAFLELNEVLGLFPEGDEEE